MKLKKKLLTRLINFYPPFVGAGIRVTHMSKHQIDAEMKLRFWNKNMMGTQFGGSLYSMIDPFFVILLVENLGDSYVVWDKSASIQYIKPGRGTVHASCKVDTQQIEHIRQDVETLGKVTPEFTVYIYDEKKEIVAKIKKVLHVHKKKNKH